MISAPIRARVIAFTLTSSSLGFILAIVVGLLRP
jgi:hypothetical protein